MYTKHLYLPLIFIAVMSQGCFSFGVILGIGEMTSFSRKYHEKGKISYAYKKDFDFASKHNNSITLNDLYDKNPKLQEEAIIQKIFHKGYQQKIITFIDDRWLIGNYAFVAEKPIFCEKGMYIYQIKSCQIRKYWKYPVLGMGLIIAVPLDIVTLPFQLLFGISAFKVKW